jgi:hypothetical protein
VTGAIGRRTLVSVDDQLLAAGKDRPSSGDLHLPPQDWRVAGPCPWGRAAEVFEAQGRLGRLLWSTVDGRRCYERQRPGGCSLTVIGGGMPELVYEIEGVDLERLR